MQLLRRAPGPRRAARACRWPTRSPAPGVASRAAAARSCSAASTWAPSATAERRRPRRRSSRRSRSCPGCARLRLSSLEPGHLDAAAPRRARAPARGAPPARAAAVGRRRGAGGHGAPVHVRRVPATLIARARERARRCRLTTDVIVGFPTEDEAAFARTLAAIGPEGSPASSGACTCSRSRAAGDGGGGAGAPAGRVVKERMGRALAAARRPPRRAAPRRRSAGRPRSSSRSGATASGGGTVHSTCATTSRATADAASW